MYEDRNKWTLLVNSNFPQNVIVHHNSELESQANLLYLKTLNSHSAKFDTRVLKFDNVVLPTGLVTKLWAWCLTPPDKLNCLPNTLILACATKSLPFHMTSSNNGGLFIWLINDVASDYKIRKQELPVTSLHKFLHKSSNEITVHQIEWHPSLPNLAARVSYSNNTYCGGIFLWMYKNNNQSCEWSVEPKCVVSEDLAVTSFQWRLQNNIYYITANPSNRHYLRCMDVDKEIQIIHVIDKKAPITDLKISPTGKHISYICAHTLHINQGHKELHSFEFGTKQQTHESAANSAELVINNHLNNSMGDQIIITPPPPPLPPTQNNISTNHASISTTTTSPPASFSHQWNPHVLNQLLILIHSPNKPQFCLIDLFSSVPTESSTTYIPPLKRYFDIRSDSISTSFTFAPWKASQSGNCDVLLYNKLSSEVEIFDIPVYLHSSGFDRYFNLAIVRNRAIFTVPGVSNYDISSIMYNRALNGYGPSFDQWMSTDLLRDNPALQKQWERLCRLRSCTYSLPKIHDRNAKKQVSGIPGILDIVNNNCSNLSMEVESCMSKMKFLDKELDNAVYDCIVRKQGLNFCGWDFKVINDGQRENLEPYIDKVHNGSNEVGATIAWVYSRAALCLTYLDKIPNAAYSLALSGYNNSSLWRDKCQLLKIDNPYLRTMFGFLANPKNPKEVLESDLTRFPDIADSSCSAATRPSNKKEREKGLTQMRLEDHVAFALKLLPHNELLDHLKELTSIYTKYGDLDGLFLTGVTPRCVDLLQSYVDRTADVQTVVLILLFSSKLMLHNKIQWDSHNLSIVNDWITQYCLLLDSWCLYSIRVQFDTAAQPFRTDGKPCQMVASCIFCSSSFTASDKKDPTRKASQFQSSSSEPKITHSCANCGNFLPRCSVCVQLLGTASTHQPMATNSSRTTAAGRAKMSQNPNSQDSLLMPPNAATASNAINVSSRTPSPSSTLAGIPASNKMNPFDSWFVWCNSCSHGGHASHIDEWFTSHSTCPVEKCKCHCDAYE